MSDNVQIYGNLDGGNPQDANSIIQTGPNAFTILPFSEDNDPNYKFRLDIEVFNNSSDCIKLDLTIDWQERRFNHLRNYIYLKHTEESDWTYLPMAAGDTNVTGEVIVKPGETNICLNPKYNYGDYLQFVAGIMESNYLKKEKIGHSPEGRGLWMIKIGADIESAHRRIMLVSRIHPYETSGSYCIEGIVNHFQKHLAPAQMNHHSPFTFNISPITIFLIPMANPDGVYNGLCKLTKIAGCNLSRTEDFKDPTAHALKQILDNIQPTIYCEIHNWMQHKYDGICYLNLLQSKKIKKIIERGENKKKKWKVLCSRFLFSEKKHGFKKYCTKQFGAKSLVLEFPWRDRTIDDMKQIGVNTLQALLKL